MVDPYESRPQVLRIAHTDVSWLSCLRGEMTCKEFHDPISGEYDKECQMCITLLGWHLVQRGTWLLCEPPA